MDTSSSLLNECVKLTKTQLSAGILCLAACVCDVMNKASMCGTSVCYLMSQLYLLFHH